MSPRFRPTPARCAPRAKSSISAGRLRRPKGASLMRGADFSLTPQRRVWCSRFRQPPPRVTVPVMQGRPVSGSSVSRASTSPLNPLQPITSYGPTIVLIVALCIDRGVRRFENATILFDRLMQRFRRANFNFRKQSLWEVENGARRLTGYQAASIDQRQSFSGEIRRRDRRGYGTEDSCISMVDEVLLLHVHAFDLPAIFRSDSQ